MNKFNFLNFVAVICMVNGFFSCKDKEEPEPESSPVPFINASVVNNIDFSSKIDTVKVVIDPDWDYSEEIYTGGVPVVTSRYNNKLSLDLSENVPDVYLKQMFYTPPSSLKISNKNIKITSAILLGYKSGSEVGIFFYVKPNNKGEITFAELMYVDSDVIVTGTVVEKNGDETDIEIYNMSLKKGWNYMFYSEDESMDGKTITYNYTTSNPGGMIWFFIDYDLEFESASVVKPKMSSVFERQITKGLLKI